MSKASPSPKPTPKPRLAHSRGTGTSSTRGRTSSKVTGVTDGLTLPRTYSVTDSEHNPKDYAHCRFIVTSEGELVLVKVRPDGKDDYVSALYADRGWLSIEVVDPLTEEPTDEAPAPETDKE